MQIERKSFNFFASTNENKATRSYLVCCVVKKGTLFDIACCQTVFSKKVCVSAKRWIFRIEQKILTYRQTCKQTILTSEENCKTFSVFFALTIVVLKNLRSCVSLPLAVSKQVSIF